MEKMYVSFDTDVSWKRAEMGHHCNSSTSVWRVFELNQNRESLLSLFKTIETIWCIKLTYISCMCSEFGNWDFKLGRWEERFGFELGEKLFSWLIACDAPQWDCVKGFHICGKIMSCDMSEVLHIIFPNWSLTHRHFVVSLKLSESA